MLCVITELVRDWYTMNTSTRHKYQISNTTGGTNKLSTPVNMKAKLEQRPVFLGEVQIGIPLHQKVRTHRKMWCTAGKIDLGNACDLSRRGKIKY